MTAKKTADKSVRTVLPNGTVIEGSVDDVARLLKAAEVSSEIPPGFYFSASKGLVKVSDMHLDHVKNALFRRYTLWIESLRDITDTNLLIVALQEGPESDRQIADLMVELVRKSKTPILTAEKNSKK